MKIEEYLKQEQRPISWLARKIGCHSQTLYNIVNGYSVPKVDLADKITEISGGLVTFKDMIMSRECCTKCKRPFRKRDKILTQSEIEVKKDVVDN